MFNKLEVNQNSENREFVELINKMWITPNQEIEHTDRGIAFCKLLWIIDKKYINDKELPEEEKDRIGRVLKLCRELCYGKELQDGKTVQDYLVSPNGCEMCIGLKPRAMSMTDLNIDIGKVEKDFDKVIYSSLTEYLEGVK